MAQIRIVLFFCKIKIKVKHKCLIFRVHRTPMSSETELNECKTKHLRQQQHKSLACEHIEANIETFVACSYANL